MRGVSDPGGPALVSAHGLHKDYGSGTGLVQAGDVGVAPGASWRREGG